MSDQNGRSEGGPIRGRKEPIRVVDPDEGYAILMRHIRGTSQLDI